MGAVTRRAREATRLARELWQLNARLRRVEMFVTDWRMFMSKTADALAELDRQLDELEQYVVSDDETDSAEVSARAARLRDLLAQVRPAAEAGAPEVDTEDTTQAGG